MTSQDLIKLEDKYGAHNYHPLPVVLAKGEGAYMWDIDGNRYIDFLSMGGPIILGHNYPVIRDNIIELIKEKGPGTGVTSEWETKTIKEIKKHIPSIEKFRFHQSGTEANISAFRVARTFTGKPYIVKIGGSYHGWSSEMVYDMHIPGTRALEAHGIPPEHQKWVKACPPNDEKKMKRIFRNAEKKGGVAAVIVEALGGESGTHHRRLDPHGGDDDDRTRSHIIFLDETDPSEGGCEGTGPLYPPTRPEIRRFLCRGPSGLKGCIPVPW